MCRGLGTQRLEMGPEGMGMCRGKPTGHGTRVLLTSYYLVAATICSLFLKSGELFIQIYQVFLRVSFLFEIS